MLINGLSSFNRKIIATAALTGLVIVMFDSLGEMAVWLLRSLVKLLYILIEMIEISLDRLVEHVFNTGLHPTQIIVVYVMLGVAVWGGYQLWRALPRWFNSMCITLKNFWSEQKNTLFYDWDTQSLLEKIGSITLFALCCAVLYFLY